MAIFRLNSSEDVFPPPELADESGVIAVGGSLTSRRLLAAYSQGIFPWPVEGYPLLWHSPDPRFVLTAKSLHIPKSLGKVLRKRTFELRLDTAFEEVIEGCARAYRPGQRGTWITPAMQRAYVALHKLGFAHSAEAWSEGELKGGLYGVSLGAAFFGESMFTRVEDASKFTFARFSAGLFERGFHFIDCQVETDHLLRFGAENWPRSRFLSALEQALSEPTKRGPWTGVIG